MRILMLAVTVTFMPNMVEADRPAGSGSSFRPAQTYYGTRNQRPNPRDFAPLVGSDTRQRPSRQPVPYPRGAFLGNASGQQGSPTAVPGQPSASATPPPARQNQSGPNGKNQPGLNGNSPHRQWQQPQHSTDTNAGLQRRQEEQRQEQERARREAERREYIRRFGDRRSQRFWRGLYGHRSRFNQTWSGYSDHGQNRFGQNQRGFTYHAQSRFNQNVYGQSFYGQNRINQTLPNYGFNLLIVPDVGNWP